MHDLAHRLHPIMLSDCFAKRSVRTATLVLVSFLLITVAAVTPRYGVVSAHHENLSSLLEASLSKRLAVDATVAELDASEVEDSRLIGYQLKPGDTLAGIWTRNGGSYAEALAAAEAFKRSEVPLSSLRAGEMVNLASHPSGGIAALHVKLRGGRELVVERDDEGLFEAQVIEPVVVERERTVTGVIRNSLSATAREVGLPFEVVDEFVDLFSGRVDFRRDVKDGDSFTVIFTVREADSGEFLSPGVIRAASFKNQGTLYAAVRHVDKNGEARYYDSQGNPIGNFFLRYPVAYSRISSVFSDDRLHPVLKIRRPHLGVDFAAPTGTPVRASADGTVLVSGYKGSSGNMVKIQHGGRYATEYLHLSKIMPGVRAGAQVKRGQHIGNVGTTGLSTGPHLHYALYIDSKYVDPLKANLPTVPDQYEKIPNRQLKTMMAALQKQHEIIAVAAAGAGKRAG